jgi:pilus assembly protein CpaB
MIPVAAVLGFIAVQAGRHWLDRQIGVRLQEAEELAHARTTKVSFGTIVVAAAPLRFGAELSASSLR